ACSPNPSIKISEEFNVAGPCIGAYLGGAYFNPNPHKTSKSQLIFHIRQKRKMSHPCDIFLLAAKPVLLYPF
ncbi:hypothetical protein, partial [Vibrio sp. SG41-7]|uniref:hypothetical protein n=1 Tax=Vibrio sp. SG41-7 TaxID=2760973 RepID=UPI001C727483